MKSLWRIALATVLALSVMLSVAVLTSSASQIIGDVDLNGNLTSADIRVILRYMVGGQSLTPAERTLADCDNNGRVDTVDSRYVLRVITLDQTPSTLPTTTTTSTTVATTTTTKTPFDDDGYYGEIVKP